MARFAAILSICAISVCRHGSVSAGSSSFEKGILMGDRAMNSACWYEYARLLPKVPDTRERPYDDCASNLRMTGAKKQLVEQGITDENDLKRDIGEFSIQYIPTLLPKARGYSDCDPYLTDPSKPPTSDMSNILKDGSEDYPFKGFAHCFISKLKDNYGNDVVSALEERSTYGDNPPVPEIVIGRDNEFRARHGAAPLKLDAELTKRAQRWADKLAKECQATHITADNPDDMYNGEHMGENIQGMPSDMDKGDVALLSSNSWYEENADYPWPAYNPYAGTASVEKFGHFTAQVWKGSKLAGYAVGKDAGCSSQYLVARYWPSGNVQGSDTYATNVGPYNKEKELFTTNT